MATKFLRIRPLGGLGEIGLNCQKWECEDGIFLMDCGLMFPDDSHFGIDAIIPSFDSLINTKEKFLGVVLTHGHEDHIGALPWLLRVVKNINIYGSAFTLALVRHKLTERGRLDRPPFKPFPSATLFRAVTHILLKAPLAKLFIPAISSWMNMQRSIPLNAAVPCRKI